jgi:hypothetical protein
LPGEANRNSRDLKVDLGLHFGGGLGPGGERLEVLAVIHSTFLLVNRWSGRATLELEQKNLQER